MPFPPDPLLSLAAHRPGARLPLQGMTLLIVDDSRFACDALRLILQRAGARLRRAENLASARRHLDTYRPDLAIVDLGLPDGCGEELIADLAAQGLPVLGLSGDPAGRERALKAGARDFLEKPITSAAELVRLIGQFAAGAGPDAGGEMGPAPPGDPAALRDDLMRAARLIQACADPAYTLSFLQSLARSARDPGLEQAARGAATQFDRSRLTRLIDDRLQMLAAVG